MTLIVVTGLAAEARLVARGGVRVIVGGGNAVRLAADVDRAIAEGGSALLSFGLAGGLEPELSAGTLLVAPWVIDREERIAADEDWNRRLREGLPHAIRRSVVGVDQPVASVADKRDLYVGSNAAAVDMELHIVARAALNARLPFAVLRVLADPVERSVPQAAIAGMRSDGRTDIGAVVRALVRNPAELPSLLRIAIDSAHAFATLRKAAAKALSSHLV